MPDSNDPAAPKATRTRRARAQDAGPAPTEEGAPGGASTTPTGESAPVTAPPPADLPVAAAWVAVMRDVGAIAKNDRNDDQHFKFRGIDAVMNTVGPIMRRHGVFVLPVKVELVESERYESKRGTAMHGLTTRHDWLIYGPRGDCMPMQTLGESADSSDKAASKAASVAYRTALLQSLTVPTGDRDPDADSPERATREEQRANDPRQPWWDSIIARGKGNKLTADELRADYKAASGHEIDGPEATVETLKTYLDRMPRPDAQQPQGSPSPEPAAEPAQPAQDTPTAPPAATAPPEPPAATQARDRQPLWDAILTAGETRGLVADTIRSDFRTWSTDQPGGPFEIDGPAATVGVLERYLALVKNGEVK